APGPRPHGTAPTHGSRRWLAGSGISVRSGCLPAVMQSAGMPIARQSSAARRPSPRAIAYASRCTRGNCTARCAPRTDMDPTIKDFESAIAELETIVKRLEDGDLALEKSLELFERGVQLSRFCHAKLEEAE